MPHSSGMYGQTYDNVWDVMSAVGAFCSPDPVFGCLGKHTISYHKNLVGWISPGQKYSPSAFTQTITLEHLALPETSNYLMAQIPIADSTTHFYTVEARHPTGYDNKLPGPAVIIHEVDTTRADTRAQIVDVDANGDTGDAGAMWTVGEVFSDQANNISVAVDSATASGFVVTIAFRPTPRQLRPTNDSAWLVGNRHYRE